MMITFLGQRLLNFFREDESTHPCILGKTTPSDFANDLRRPPRIRFHLADFPSFIARAICVISSHAEYNIYPRGSDYLTPGLPTSLLLDTPLLLLPFLRHANALDRRRMRAEQPFVPRRRRYIVLVVIAKLEFGIDKRLRLIGQFQRRLIGLCFEVPADRVLQIGRAH